MQSITMNPLYLQHSFEVYPAFVNSLVTYTQLDFDRNFG